MNKLFAAVALSIAIPAIAPAQATPAPALKAEKMNCDMECCKDKAVAKGQAGQDMKSGTAPQADPHHGHQG